MGILALTDIPTIWDIKSVLSVFGILYLVVSIAIIIKAGGLQGGLSLLCMAIVGAFLVGISGPGEYPDHLPSGDSGLTLYVICKNDNDQLYWGPLVQTVRAEEKWRFNVKQNEFSPVDDYHVSPDPKVYAMHIPDHPTYVNPSAFHPASFFWSPFIMSVIGICWWLVKGMFYF